MLALFSFFLALLDTNRIKITSTHPGPLYRLVFKYNTAGAVTKIQKDAYFYFNADDG